MGIFMQTLVQWVLENVGGLSGPGVEVRIDGMVIVEVSNGSREGIVAVSTHGDAVLELNDARGTCKEPLNAPSHDEFKALFERLRAHVIPAAQLA